MPHLGAAGRVLRRAGAAIGRNGRAALAGARASTPSLAAAAAREHAAADQHGLVKPGLVGAGVAAGVVAARNGKKRVGRGCRWAWRKARKVARRMLGRPPDPDETATETTSAPAPPPAVPHTAATVRQPPPDLIPVAPIPGGTSMAANTPPAPSAASSPLFAAAQQFHAAAATFSPRGMLPRRQELYDMPHTLTEIAQAVRKIGDKCSPAKAPLHPDIQHTLDQIAQCVDAAARTAQLLGPAVDSRHAVEVHRLFNPRADERAWDVGENAA